MKKIKLVKLFTDGKNQSRVVDIPSTSYLFGLDNKTLMNSAKLLNVNLA